MMDVLCDALSDTSSQLHLGRPFLDSPTLSL